MKLIINLKNEIHKIYPDIEGTYILSNNKATTNHHHHHDFEKKSAQQHKRWLQENGINVIWYDKDNNSWNIGDKDNMDTGNCKLRSAEAIDTNKEPCDIKKWEYFEPLGFDWVSTSSDVGIQGMNIDFTTIIFKIYLKNTYKLLTFVNVIF